jgi:hypothetical protein
MIRISPRSDDKVILELLTMAIVDYVNPWIHMLVPDPCTVGDVGDPACPIVTEKVVRLSR